MKTTQLTTNEDRQERTFFTLLCLAGMIGLLLISAVASGQEAIKIPARTNTRAHETFKNIQGFALPATVPDSTRVYQIEGSKSKFYFRRSANTGKLYKVYLKTDSASLVNEPVKK
jgi:hypothetical protein